METRQSARRRLSASSSTGTSTSNDEALGLLTQDGNEEELSVDFKARSRSFRGELSKWLRPLGVVFAVLVLFIIAATSSSKLIPSFSYFSNLHPPQNAITEVETPDDTLGIRLHPEDHVSRRPDIIIHYWNVSTGYIYPDGVRKKVYLINDGFPGPTIECRSGDRLVVHVTNSLSEEGVSIHWHGLEMRNRSHMDGAVGFSQCSIPPGKYFSYDFRVGEDQAGTFWYHAHSQVERGDGMYGGLVVHKPILLENEMQTYGYEKEVLLLVGDWYHRSAEEVLGWYTSIRGFGNEVGISLILHCPRACI
jgi:FtsP/CotA-like multicopper oxidase with cupredoxin domain